MPLNLALICSAERLFPHDSSTEMVLGVNVVVAAVPPVGVADLDRNWLEPWRWSPVTAVRVRVIGIDAGGNPVDRNIPATIWTHPAPPTAAEVTAAKDALQRRWDEQIAVGEAAFVWDPRDPGAPPPAGGFHRAVVGGASTTAGALSHALNLAFTVKIPLTGFQASDFFPAGTQTFFHKLRLVVAPVVQVGGASLTPSAGAIPGDPVAEWPYVAAGGAPPATAHMPSVILNNDDPAGRFFKLGTYWVCEPATVPTADPGDDWTSKLADRVADAWNLPRHLIDAMQRSLTKAEFERVWEITLVALRDRAGTGTGAPPDGRSLFRVAADIVTPEHANAVAEAVREWRIESLREQFAVFERATTLPMWHKILQDAGAITNRVPLAAPVPPGPNIPVDALDPLAGVVAALADDTILAKVVAAQWQRFATVGLRLDSPGTTFGPLFTARRLTTSGSTKFVNPRWPATGTLDLTGRNTWAITLTDIALVNPNPVWVTGPKYQLRFPSGDQEAPAETMVVEAVFAVTGPGNDPTLTITVSGAGLTPVPRDVVLPAGAIRHGLRVTFVPAGDTTNVIVEVIDVSPPVAPLAPIPLAGDEVQTLTLSGSPTGGTFALGVPRDDGTITPTAAIAFDATAAQVRAALAVVLGAGNVAVTGSGGGPWEVTCVGNLSHRDVALLALHLNNLTGGTTPTLGIVEKTKGFFAKLPAAAVLVRYAAAGSPAGLIASPPSVFASTPNVSFTNVLNAWKAFGSDPVRGYWDEFGRDLQRLLPTLHPRRRLAREQTGLLWAAWHFYDRDEPNPVESVRQRFTMFFRRMAKQRFGWAPVAEAAPGLYADCKPAAVVPEVTLRTLIDDHLSSFADPVAARIVPWSATSAGPGIPGELDADLVPTPTPHGWTVAVDRPDRFGEADTGTDDDLTRRVAGVGVLLRQASTAGAAITFAGQPWRVLNAADVVAVTAVSVVNDSRVPTFARAARRASVPIRGRYQDDVRQTVITYDNQSLIAASLASAVAHFDGSLSDASTDDAFGPFRFTPPTKDQGGNDVPTDPVPTLKFGQCYERIHFLIGNAGSHPAPLTDNHPAALAASIPDALAGTANCVRRLRYLRRVQVGLPRPDDEVELARLIRTPPNVLPLARELGLRALSPTRATDEYRFFYDTKWATGQLNVGAHWQLTLPRAIATGCPHADPTEAVWVVEFGLIDEATGKSVIARVIRAGTQLKAMLVVNDTNLAELEAAVPAVGGADLRVEAKNGTVTFFWRESEHGAAWSNRDKNDNAMAWTPAAVPVMPHGFVVVRPVAAAVRPTFSPPVYGSRRDPADGFVEDVVPPPETPLAVLSPDAEVATFKLRPPAADFQTWARWYDMSLALGQDGATAAKRLEVWQDYHAKLPAPGRTAPPDLVPDDPAVKGVLVEWIPLLAESTDAQPAVEFLKVRNLAHPNKTLPHVQAAPWEFQVQQQPVIDPTTGNAKRLTKSSASKVVAVAKEKELWELRVYPAVLEERFSGNESQPGVRRFHSAFCGAQKYTDADGTIYRLSAPWRLAVEVATRDVIQLTMADQTKVTPRAPAAVGWEAAVPVFDGRHARVRLNKLARPTIVASAGGTLTLDADPWRFRYAAEIRLRRQVWRWRGRSVPPFPFAAANPDAFPAAGGHEFNTPMLWDTAGFGDRSGIDMLDEVRGVNAGTVAAELFAEDLQSDGRALYYRFAAQYISRYAGLFPDVPTVAAAQHAVAQVTTAEVTGTVTDGDVFNLICNGTTVGTHTAIAVDDGAKVAAGLSANFNAATGGAATARGTLVATASGATVTMRGTAGAATVAVTKSVTAGDDADISLTAVAVPVDSSPWRRLVVPARRTATVPRPVVRFVIPLTEVTDTRDRGRVPGMLVVLDEPAFAVGGLAEAIEAEVVRVDDPLSNVSRPEWGPEVQARGKGWVASAHPNPGGATGSDPPAVALPFDTDGPIGHTFDTDAEAPLFGSATYIVSPPDVPPITGDIGLGGYFAKLRFRRLLLPEGTADSDLPLLPAAGFKWAAFDDDRALLVSATVTTAADGIVTLHDAGGTTLRRVRATRLAGAVRFTFDGPPAIVELPIKGSADVTIEVRVIFQNQELPAAGGGTVRSRNFTVSYRVPGPTDNLRANRWRTLQAAMWPEAAWPTEVRVTGGQPSVRLRPARVSAYTPPYWVQLLSDAAALLPDHSVEYLVRWHASGLKFQLVRNGVASTWGLGLRSDWPPAGEGAEFCLRRRLVVTELVRDVRGQWGQERYLGLYEPAAGDWLERQHRSPALAVDEREQDLPQIRVRVVEFKEDKERTTRLRYPADSPLLPHRPWGALFDPPDATAQDARTADVPYHVTGVSPPVTLYRESP